MEENQRGFRVEEMERSKNTVRNIGWGFIYQILTLLLPFIIRTIILHILGEEYLGLNSLFASILNVLNMAELGFSSAIVFSMYEPIAKNDKDTICALMAYYKKVYVVVGLVVLGLGLSIMVFLDKLIKGSHPADINLYILYGIYLFNAVISYFLFAYKSTLLAAFHRNDISSKISIVITIIQHGIQILILVLWKNYYLYIALLPIATITTNILNNHLSKKYYPGYDPKGSLSLDVREKIKKQVKGLMVSKICGTLRNSTDSIILSAFIGLSVVAMYTNYYYILNAVHGILTIIGVSMKSGVGNSIVKDNKKKNYRDFEKFTFIYIWLAGWFSCCLFCIYQPFMKIWTGKESMILPFCNMIMFCIYFFSLCLTDIRNVYMDAIGLWWEARYRSIAESIGNLVLNIGLGYLFGITGIIIATLITLIIINIGYGTKILFDNFFNEEKIMKYIYQLIIYSLVTAIVSIICYFICNIPNFSGYMNLFFRGICCVIIPNILFFIFYYKNKNYKESKIFIVTRLYSFIHK